jgi:hypothetical protein
MSDEVQNSALAIVVTRHYPLATFGTRTLIFNQVQEDTFRYRCTSQRRPLAVAHRMKGSLGCGLD